MSINTKIILKVKSGPGEIIGLNEFDVIDNFVNISSIQFSDPGEYVISIIPTNREEVEEGEFLVNILPQEEFIPQEDRDVEEKEITGTRPIIAQITQPSIKLDPIEFETSSDKTDNTDIGSNLGYIPFVWYNGQQIRSSDINKLDLYYEDIYPKCQLNIRDTLGLISSPETMPLNNTKFEIFINSGSDILKSIHLKFKLELIQNNKNGSITITGIIDLDDFYKISYKSYNDTSFGALKKISTELGLGFNSNIDQTEDSMKWRRSGTNVPDFINDIISHSYISDTSFMSGYIDYYWSFNYIDVEKEWKRDISNDVGLVSQGIVSIGQQNIVPLELTNDKSENSSPFYFTNFKLNNNSTFQTTRKGVFTVSKVYDRVNKQFLKFNIDSQTSTGDDSVILKGSPGDSVDITNNFITSYGGAIDTNNVHKNYLYAVEQNNRNFENLVNISADLELPQPNFNLYKYQKIKINFINPKPTVSNEKVLDERLSGEWMLIDISYSWSSGSLKQKLAIVRKELGKTKTEIEEQVVSPDIGVNNSQISENPITAESLENIPIVEFVFQDDDISLVGSEFLESEFVGEEELAMDIELRSIEQDSSEPGPPTPESTGRVDDTVIDSNMYIGESWKSFDIQSAIAMIKRTKHGPSSIFEKSLEKTLYFIKNDPQIKDIREAAYLLGTAYEESGYSLQRWEADYVCGKKGKPYDSGGPCQSALNYYRKSTGKKNYYELGVDKRGFPYFGRGLIQLTGKENYEKFGKKIGVDLVNNGDLALEEQNSYKIAVNFMLERTFKWVMAGDLKRARKSVNGGDNGIENINSAYSDWLDILSNISKKLS